MKGLKDFIGVLKQFQCNMFFEITPRKVKMKHFFQKLRRGISRLIFSCGFKEETVGKCSTTIYSRKMFGNFLPRSLFQKFRESDHFLETTKRRWGDGGRSCTTKFLKAK